MRKTLADLKHTVIAGHRVYKLDSGGTRVAARVSEGGASGASGERRRLFKSPPGAARVATYGGLAGSHGGCAPKYVTHVQGNGRSSLTEPFGHMPHTWGCRPSEPLFFTPSCTHDSRRSDLCSLECRWSRRAFLQRLTYIQD